MQIGQVIDYVIDYNEREEKARKRAEHPPKRKATQDEINAFFG